MTSGKRFLFVGVVGVIACSAIAIAQVASGPSAPATVIIGTYRIAPGKHLDFLRYAAARDAVNREVGAPEGQWYLHLDGDSWDFLNISPDFTDEQRARADEILKKRGLSTGLPAAIEMRRYVASHTDTFARGPHSAADLLRLAGEK